MLHRLPTAALALSMLASCTGSHGPDNDAGTPANDAATVDAATFADAGTAEYAGSYVTPDCAPDDGPAIRLLMWEVPVPECSADPSHGSLELYIFGGTDSVFPITAPVTITSSGAGGGLGNGSATECPGGTPPCRTSSDWSVTVETYEENAGASGTYTVTFAGETVSGRFDASWCSFAPPTCG